MQSVRRPVLVILAAAALAAAFGAADSRQVFGAEGLVVRVTCGDVPSLAGETATCHVTFANTSPCLTFFVVSPPLFFPGGGPAGSFFSLDPSASLLLEGRKVLTEDDVAGGSVSFTLQVQTSPAGCLPQSFEVGTVCEITQGDGEDTEPCNLQTLTEDWKGLFKEWTKQGSPDTELKRQGDAQLREAGKLQREGKNDEARAELEQFAQESMSQELEDRLAQDDTTGGLTMILDHLRRCVRFLLGIDPGDWRLDPPNGGGHTFLPGLDPDTRDPIPFSDKEKERLLETLAKIPLPLGGSPTTFRRAGSRPDSPATWEPEDRVVVIADEFFRAGAGEQSCILQHELAHRYHQENFEKVYGYLAIGWDVPEATRPKDFLELKARSLSAKSGESPILRDKKDEVAPYDPIEDFGRSVELYVCDPDTLKSQSPARYDWIKDNVFDGKEFPKK